jgi:Tfp pilus assembly protein PilN
MTVDIPTRAPEQAAPGGDRRHIGLPPRGVRNVGKAPLVVGGEPRANLLPPEIILKRKQLKTRRALRAGVLLVALATAAGCVATFGVSSVAQVQLAIVEQQQSDLVIEQAGYQKVRDVQLTLATITAGQQVGSSTEVNWRSFIQEIQDNLPAGVALQTVKVETGTPMQAYPQSDAPLQGIRVGSISFTASSATLPNTAEWLRALDDMSGYVDAIPGSVKQEGSAYTAEVLMHFNEQAFSLRFDPAHVAEVEAAAAAAAKSDGTIKSLVAAVDATTDEEGN